jgi:hypothetical protein
VSGRVQEWEWKDKVCLGQEWEWRDKVYSWPGVGVEGQDVVGWARSGNGRTRCV